jgi:RNA 2',3'-cyclic 3'-phosphodiesterase
MIRCFIALVPPPEVHARLAGVRRELVATGADVRWVREEGMHCTLAFLGSVEEARLEKVREALGEALARQPSFHVRARGIGVFPSWTRPKVIWIGLKPPTSNVERNTSNDFPALAARVADSLEPLGFPREARPFQAHITLGRVRSRAGWSELSACMRRREDEDFGTMAIERLVAYRSNLGPGGSRYTPLWTIALAETSLPSAPDPGREDGGCGA